MKKQLLRLVSFVGLTIAFGGCVSITSSGISSAEKVKDGQSVSVTVTGDPGILALSSPTDLTRSANKALLAKCDSGTLTDIQTQLSVRNFLGIVQIYKVRATGVCKG